MALREPAGLQRAHARSCRSAAAGELPAAARPPSPSCASTACASRLDVCRRSCPPASTTPPTPSTPDGHCIQLYYYMEQVGWDGRPRPAALRRHVQDPGPTRSSRCRTPTRARPTRGRGASRDASDDESPRLGGASMSARRMMHLVAFLKTGPTCHHHGMWRHPESDNDFLDPAWYEHVARVLEKGKFDCLFFADTLGIFDLYKRRLRHDAGRRRPDGPPRSACRCWRSWRGSRGTSASAPRCRRRLQPLSDRPAHRARSTT